MRSWRTLSLTHLIANYIMSENMAQNFASAISKTIMDCLSGSSTTPQAQGPSLVGGLIASPTTSLNQEAKRKVKAVKVF